MQHHGAPTRLLDFTWSKYVAAFYALSDPRSCDAAIWALYPPALADSEKFGPWVYGNFEKYFLPNTKSIVVIGEPHHMNQRLISHSGTFVVPGKLAVPVEDIVATDINSEPLVKLTLATDRVRRDAIKALYNMNITHATLFPDLDGLARSLGFELELHWKFDPVSGDEYIRS
jgi:FRG domain-containing protein